MNYNTFLKLTVALKKYIVEHPNHMCSAMRIERHLLPGVSHENVSYVMHRYKSYAKGRYSLDKLIISIILCKYGINETFENYMGCVTKPKYMVLGLSRCPNLRDYIKEFEQFMYEGTI